MSLQSRQIDQYRQMHAAGRYGASSVNTAPYIIPHIRQLRPASVIDYGCGQSALPDMIQDSGVPTVHRYDPAIPAYAERPAACDLLVCIDVLEHVPEPALDVVLSDMAGLARHALLIIDIEPAPQFLPNGENAHCTVRPPEWWRALLARHYGCLEPFFSKPLARARFKTWPTPVYSYPLIFVHRLILRQRRRQAKKQAASFTAKVASP
jgi:hypothetical protein